MGKIKDIIYDAEENLKEQGIAEPTPEQIDAEVARLLAEAAQHAVH